MDTHKMSDPYTTLGVFKTTPQADIKSAYRKLAKKYHPDLNPGNKEAEKKFKEISHAHDLIGTVEGREKFDREEADEQIRHQQSRKRPSYQDTQHGGGRYSSAFGEGMDEDDIFANIFGKSNRSFDLQGQDELYQLEVEFLEAVLGGEKIITLPSGKKLQVKIPAGIQEGKKLKFKGLGAPGNGKGAAGDAYVQIFIKKSTQFIREENDIISEVPISLFEAINGSEIEVPTVDGTVMLKIPSGVTTGTKLRIKNKGVGSGESRGNHIVKLKVVMPKDPSAELKETIANLASRFSYNPREIA
jgi:DnaJ-class molecular chaperone